MITAPSVWSMDHKCFLGVILFVAFWFEETAEGSDVPCLLSTCCWIAVSLIGTTVPATSSPSDSIEAEYSGLFVSL